MLLRASGARDHLLLPTAVFEQLGPIGASRISLELGPCLLWRGPPSLCRAAVCDAFSCGSAAEEAPVPKQWGTEEMGLLLLQCSHVFIPPGLPCSHPLPSPGPGLARSTLRYKGLKTQDHFYSVGTKGFLCCNSSVQLCTRSLRGAQQPMPCMSGTKADCCGHG